MHSIKPFKTIDEQIEILVVRGIKGDPLLIKRALIEIGYYRLSGYTLAFKDSDDKFIPGTSIEQVLQLYSLDIDLRELILSMLGSIEVYFKSQIAYSFGKRISDCSLLNRENFKKLTDKEYEVLINKCAFSFNHSKEIYVEHFKRKYSKNLYGVPPWILMNIVDFGTLMTIYRGSVPDIKREISTTIDVPYNVLSSWLLSLSTLRNTCAHQGRLYGRRIGSIPKMPRKVEGRLLKIPHKEGYLSQHLILIEYISRYLSLSKKWDSIWGKYLEIDNLYSQIRSSSAISQ